MASFNRDALPSKAVKNEWREEVAAAHDVAADGAGAAACRRTTCHCTNWGRRSASADVAGRGAGAAEGGGQGVRGEGGAPRPGRDADDRRRARDYVGGAHSDAPRTEGRRTAACATSASPHPLLPPQVHVQQLHHQHIVRVMDVIDLVDATYIVMERVDGPEVRTPRLTLDGAEPLPVPLSSSPQCLTPFPLPPQLTDYIEMHETCREANASHDDIHGGSSVVPLACCQRFFAQLVAALCHAHGSRLRPLRHQAAERPARQDVHARRVDRLGVRRQAGDQKSPITHGTPRSRARAAHRVQLRRHLERAAAAGRRRRVGARRDALHDGGAAAVWRRTFEDLVRNVLALNYEEPVVAAAAAARSGRDDAAGGGADRASLKELKAHDWVVGGWRAMPTVSSSSASRATTTTTRRAAGRRREVERAPARADGAVRLALRAGACLAPALARRGRQGVAPGRRRRRRRRGRWVGG